MMGGKAREFVDWYRDSFKGGEEYALEMCQKVIDYYKANGKYPSSKSKDLETAKLGRWLSNMKKASRGKGSCVFYNSLLHLADYNGLSDMFDLVDKEAIALEHCQKVIDYYNANGKYPSTVDKDSEVVGLARWRNCMKATKHGNGHVRFYKSVQRLAIKNGLFDMFDMFDNEAMSLEQCHKVIDWMNQNNGKTPSTNSSDPIEQKHGRWIINLRSAKQGGGHMRFYKSVEVLAVAAGYDNLFNGIDYEDIAKNNCLEVIDWMNEHAGKTPSGKSKNPIEQKHGRWLYQMRTAKQGRRWTRFYESIEMLAVEAGYDNLFNTINKETTTLERCQEVIRWMDRNKGRKPLAHSKDPTEALYGRWISTQRQAFMRRSGKPFYESVGTMVVKAGYGDMFNIKDKQSL